MQIRALLATCSLAALVACSGGGAWPLPHPSGAPSPSPTGGPWPNIATVTLTFRTAGPGGSAAPAYVSPNTAKLVTIINTVNGGPPPSWVPASTTSPLDFGAGGNCTLSAGTATCTLTIPGPPGSVNYTFDAEDASSNILSTATGTFAIVQGVVNTLNVTLLGIVHAVTVSGAALAANSAASETLTVSALDASGAQIGAPGAYANPFTLTDNDATGQTSLKLNGGAASGSVVVSAPSDVVTLVYTGQATNNVAIAASGTGITGGGTVVAGVNDVTFAGTTLDNAANGGLNTDANWGQQTLFFSSASGSQNVTGAEIGFTNVPYGRQFDLVLSAGCAGVATASAGPATTFAITATAVGVCSARLKEHGAGYPLTNHAANVPGSATHDGTFWISVTSASFGINGSGKR